MQRDTRKTSEYFEYLLPEFTTGISDLTMSLIDGTLTLPDELTKHSHELFELQLLYCIACYSSGESVEQLKPKVEKILATRKYFIDQANTLPPRQQVYRHQFEELVGNDGRYLTQYMSSLWWLSLVVATGQPNDHRIEVINCIGNKGKDALLDRIAIEMGDANRPQATTLVYPHLYKHLLEAFDAPKGKRASLIEQFLNEWYSNSWQVAWYDNHAKEDDEEGNWDFYVGYWSFEAALVINLLIIDTSSYRNNDYFPADLISI